MCRKSFLATALCVACLFAPEFVFAAGAGGTELIVVADTRRVSAWWEIYFMNVYNTNLTLYGIWCLIITLVYGMSLGLIADFIMKRTGIDLEHRTIVEH
ncbi:MAG: hypothetical protein QG577_769 [Thermodesulfobacteriota bacterium]|nr:hypothetical protein [Thermodesulfobacteriota bacterium]